MTDTLIVVITKNRIDMLKQCIDSLVASELDDAYLLAIDNGSTDGTYRYLQTVKRLNQCIQNPKNTPQWQKAYAIRQAYNIFKKIKGMEYFGWIDDDMVLQPDWLKAGRRILEQPNIHVAAMHNDERQQKKHRTSSKIMLGPYEVHLKHTSNGPVWLVHRSFVKTYGLPPVTGRTDGASMSDRYYDKKLYRCGKWIGVVDKSTHLGYKRSLRMILQGKQKAPKAHPKRKK